MVNATKPMFIYKHYTFIKITYSALPKIIDKIRII